MKLDYRYRALPLIKKDQTLVEILDRLKSLENKIDRIPIRAPILAGIDDPSSYSVFLLCLSQQPGPISIGKNQLSR
jgi:hypothetical protein